MNLLRDEEGQALVEFALVSALFIFLFVGIVDYSIYIHMQIELNEAAAAAAAFGATPDNQTNTALITAIAQNAASDVGGLNTAVAILYECTQGGAAVSQTTTCNGNYDNRPLQYIQVTTSASIPAALKWSGMPNSISLQGQATYRVRWYQ